MGKVKGLSPSRISGSVGNYTFRQTKDGTIVTEKMLNSSYKCNFVYNIY